MRLRIEMEDFRSQKLYIEYDNFSVGSRRENYRLKSVGTTTGTGS